MVEEWSKNGRRSLTSAAKASRCRPSPLPPPPPPPPPPVSEVSLSPVPLPYAAVVPPLSSSSLAARCGRGGVAEAVTLPGGERDEPLLTP